MRHSSLILCLFLASLAALSVAQSYTTKYDDIDVDRILSNERILKNYIKCMLDEGPCTAEGKELKKTLPDALVSGCSKCNEKQKTTTEKVVKHLTNKRPRDWERLARKFDPQGTFKKRYEEQYGKLL